MSSDLIGGYISSMPYRVDAWSGRVANKSIRIIGDSKSACQHDDLCWSMAKSRLSGSYIGSLYWRFEICHSCMSRASLGYCQTRTRERTRQELGTRTRQGPETRSRKLLEPCIDNLQRYPDILVVVEMPYQQCWSLGNRVKLEIASRQDSFKNNENSALF